MWETLRTVRCGRSKKSPSTRSPSPSRNGTRHPLKSGSESGPGREGTPCDTRSGRTTGSQHQYPFVTGTSGGGVGPNTGIGALRKHPEPPHSSVPPTTPGTSTALETGPVHLPTEDKRPRTGRDTEVLSEKRRDAESWGHILSRLKRKEDLFLFRST